MRQVMRWSLGVALGLFILFGNVACSSSGATTSTLYMSTGYGPSWGYGWYGGYRPGYPIGPPRPPRPHPPVRPVPY